MTDDSWNKKVLASGEAPHYMQSEQWAEFKHGSPWHQSRITVDIRPDLPMQVFTRPVRGLGNVHYSPQPIGVSDKEVFKLTETIKAEYPKGLAFKLELYQPNSEKLTNMFIKHGWQKGNHVQYRDTVVVDLTGSEKEVFERMKRRARYECRVGERNNIKVKKMPADEKTMQEMVNMLSITSRRTGAFIRNRTYLEKYWQLFAKNDMGDFYFAYYGQDVLATAFVIKFGRRGWYKDGASHLHETRLMASRYLQWEIMKDLKSQGIESYDLSGIPSQAELETGFMKGIHTFKTGFAPDTVTFMPALELPMNKRFKLWPKTEKHYLRAYSKLKKDFWY